MELYPAADETLAGIRDEIRAGRLSCVSIVERCLSRINASEPDLRAWVSVDRDGALQRAEELDADLAAGINRGPLHGIPIGIKDIVDVAGTPTGAGSPLKEKEPPAREDAPLVTRLREAGAIILGKTVTTLFACFDPPPTRNPWNLERTPGGSSSGSAAGVAAGMCLAAIGSQTGGSITRPAAFCGVAGCKPGFGTVSVQGVVPVATSLDHPGPLARTVRDLGIMMSVLQDGTSPEAGTPDQPLRVGRLRGFHEDKATDDMKNAIEQALDWLRPAGAEIVDVPVPEGFAELPKHHRLVMAVEAAEWHQTRFARHRDDYRPHIAALIEDGLATEAIDYVRAREHQLQQTRAMSALLDDVDVLVTPAATGPAPDVSQTGDPSMNAPWSFTGLPTVSFPVGLASDGMPLSIQLAGRHGQGELLLNRAAWCEGVVRTNL